MQVKQIDLIERVVLLKPFYRLLITVVTALTLLSALSACNSGSISEGLESAARPSQSVNQPSSSGTAPSGGQVALDASTTAVPPAQSQANQAGQQVASLPTGRTVTFLPVSNAPQSAVTNLARSISSAASNAGVPVVGSVQQGAEFQVKGYFSALEDGSGTLLVYVWDVLDRNNKRVYRINGQEQSSSKSADPWGAISPEMLDRVAKTTVSQLKSWLANR